MQINENLMKLVIKESLIGHFINRFTFVPEIVVDSSFLTMILMVRRKSRKYYKVGTRKFSSF